MGATYRGEPTFNMIPLAGAGRPMVNPHAEIFRRSEPMDLVFRLLKAQQTLYAYDPSFIEEGFQPNIQNVIISRGEIEPTSSVLDKTEENTEPETIIEDAIEDNITLNDSESSDLDEIQEIEINNNTESEVSVDVNPEIETNNKNESVDSSTINEKPPSSKIIDERAIFKNIYFNFIFIFKKIYVFDVIFFYKFC